MCAPWLSEDDSPKLRRGRNNNSLKRYWQYIKVDRQQTRGIQWDELNRDLSTANFFFFHDEGCSVVYVNDKIMHVRTLRFVAMDDPFIIQGIFGPDQPRGPTTLSYSIRTTSII
jgi:hypothetical protein